MVLGMVEQVYAPEGHAYLVAESPAVTEMHGQFAKTAIAIVRYGGQKRILLMDEIEFQLLEHHFFRAEIVAE